MEEGTKGCRARKANMPGGPGRVPAASDRPCVSWQSPHGSPWSITLARLMWELLQQGVAVQCWRTCPGAQSQVLFLSHSQQGHTSNKTISPPFPVPKDRDAEMYASAPAMCPGAALPWEPLSHLGQPVRGFPWKCSILTLCY